MQARHAIAALTVAALFGLGACASADSDDDGGITTPTSTPEPSGSAGPSEPPSPSGTTVEITIEGDSISPNGKRIDAAVGEPITFKVTSDRAGELHVHTSPSQEVEYGVGTSRFQLIVERPGIVEVEDHDAGLVVVQLEVS